MTVVSTTPGSARALAGSTWRPRQAHLGRGTPRGVFSARAPKTAREARALPRNASRALVVFLLIFATSASSFAQTDPASEPAVLAVAKVLPAVVNINTERIVRRRVRDPFEDFAAQYFGNYRSRPREIRQTLQSLGSGFIVDPAGYIVTNDHVVQRAADLKIEVTMNDGKTYNAHYITGDKKKDLAFIKIDAKADFPFINLDNISPNLLGQTVLVVGNAAGYGSSISRGILSGTKRDITIDETEYKDLLQTDAAINPGNSGGPLVDLSGRLVGVSSAKMAFTPQGVPTQGLGFAIPAETVRASVAEFKVVAQNKPTPKEKPAGSETTGPQALRFFGLQLQNLTPDLTSALGYMQGRGVLVSAVEPESPADRAGIRRGLVIYRVGRYNVSSIKQLESLLARVESGSSVDFTVGIVRANGQGQQVETVPLTAR